MELAAQAAFLGRKAHTVGHGLSDICKNIRVKPKSLGQCECENAPALPRTLKSRPTVYPSPSERLPVLKLRNRWVVGWSVVIEAEGEIFISFLPLEPEGWPRNFAKFGVTPDGDIFINPAILSDGARLAALISGVAVWIAGGPLLAPLSWAEANYPEHAEMLHDLGMYIRESVSCSFPREKTSRQVAATEDHANGNK